MNITLIPGKSPSGLKDGWIAQVTGTPLSAWGPTQANALHFLGNTIEWKGAKPDAEGVDRT